jgi:hypothetical protein
MRGGHGRDRMVFAYTSIFFLLYMNQKSKIGATVGKRLTWDKGNFV